MEKASKSRFRFLFSSERCAHKATFSADHREIAGLIQSGWHPDPLQGTHRHNGYGDDIHRIRQKDISTSLGTIRKEINLGNGDQSWFDGPQGEARDACYAVLEIDLQCNRWSFSRTSIRII